MDETLRSGRFRCKIYYPYFSDAFRFYIYESPGGTTTISESDLDDLSTLLTDVQNRIHYLTTTHPSDAAWDARHE